MKNLFSIMLFSLFASALSFNVLAEDMQSAEQDIKAECKEESKNAESPEIYFEECVADRLQALKEEQGGSGDLPPAERG